MPTYEEDKDEEVRQAVLLYKLERSDENGIPATPTAKAMADALAITTLDPDDPFDSVLIDMVKTNRSKRRDYAADTDIFSNFRGVASDLGLAGFGPIEAAYSLLLTKVNRLKSLRLNGRMDDPSNESVLDTYLDLAVYATLVLGLVKERNESQG